MRFCLSILALAAGLAMDATAVSAARGLAVPRVLPCHVLLVAIYPGGSQALRPLVGRFFGAKAGSLVAAFAHWIAFTLVGATGGKLLWEVGTSDAAEQGDGDPFGPQVRTLLVVATSIDALAVGITLPNLGDPLNLSIATIGVMTGWVPERPRLPSRWRTQQDSVRCNTCRCSTGSRST